MSKHIPTFLIPGNPLSPVLSQSKSSWGAQDADSVTGNQSGDFEKALKQALKPEQKSRSKSKSAANESASAETDDKSPALKEGDPGSDVKPEFSEGKAERPGSTDPTLALVAVPGTATLSESTLPDSSWPLSGLMFNSLAGDATPPPGEKQSSEIVTGLQADIPLAVNASFVPIAPLPSPLPIPVLLTSAQAVTEPVILSEALQQLPATPVASSSALSPSSNRTERPTSFPLSGEAVEEASDRDFAEKTSSDSLLSGNKSTEALSSTATVNLPLSMLAAAVPVLQASADVSTTSASLPLVLNQADASETSVSPGPVSLEPLPLASKSASLTDTPAMSVDAHKISSNASAAGMADVSLQSAPALEETMLTATPIPSDASVRLPGSVETHLDPTLPLAGLEDSGNNQEPAPVAMNLSQAAPLPDKSSTGKTFPSVPTKSPPSATLSSNSSSHFPGSSIEAIPGQKSPDLSRTGNDDASLSDDLDFEPMPASSESSPLSSASSFGETLGTLTAVASTAGTASSDPPPSSSALPPAFSSLAANPADQVLDGTVYSVKNGHKELIIRLNPDNLGEVRINLSSRDDGGLSARFIASTPESRDVLQAQVKSLQISLESQGVRVERLSVILAGQTETVAETASSGGSRFQAASDGSPSNHDSSSSHPRHSNSHSADDNAFARQSSLLGEGGGQGSFSQPRHGGYATAPSSAIRRLGGVDAEASENGLTAVQLPQPTRHHAGQVSILA